MHKLAWYLSGAKYLHTRDIGKLKNMYALFLWGAPGGAPRICGGHVPPPPP